VWNAGLESGGFLVGDEVKIEIDVEIALTLLRLLELVGQDFLLTP